MTQDEFVIISKTAILKRIEELKKDYGKKAIACEHQWCSIIAGQIMALKQVLSQSTPLIPDIKDIQIWLSKQSYQKEYGEQEYMMYYDVDVPKIIQDYISNLKLDI